MLGEMKTWSAEYFKAQGRRGGKKSRAALTPAQRTEAARKAAQARWKRKTT